MDQNNIEKQIKKGFQDRKINPSAQAWDRLDAMLAVAAAPKKKRSFKFWYFAAALVLIATCTVIITVFNRETTLEIMPNQEVVNQAEELQTNKVLQVVEAKPEVNVEISGNFIQKEVVVARNPLANSEVRMQEKVSDAMRKSISKTIDNNVLAGIETPVIEEVAVLSNSAATLLAAIEKPKNSLQAAKQPAKEIEIASVKVDPVSLLESSEKEVEHSFRMKIIKNIKIVKSSLANRNSE
jgi:hypothetical protein